MKLCGLWHACQTLGMVCLFPRQLVFLESPKPWDSDDAIEYDGPAFWGDWKEGGGRSLPINLHQALFPYGITHPGWA